MTEPVAQAQFGRPTTRLGDEGLRSRVVTTDWSLYLRGQLHRLGWRPADLARSIEVSESSVSRWLHGAVPSADRVRAVARVIGRSEAEAMHIAGYGAATTERVEVQIGARDLSDVELLAEIKRRFEHPGSPRLFGRAGSMPAEVRAEMEQRDRRQGDVP